MLGQFVINPCNCASCFGFTSDDGNVERSAFCAYATAALRCTIAFSKLLEIFASVATFNSGAGGVPGGKGGGVTPGFGAKKPPFKTASAVCPLLTRSRPPRQASSAAAASAAPVETVSPTFGRCAARYIVPPGAPKSIRNAAKSCSAALSSTPAFCSVTALSAAPRLFFEGSSASTFFRCCMPSLASARTWLTRMAPSIAPAATTSSTQASTISATVRRLDRARLALGAPLPAPPAELAILAAGRDGNTSLASSSAYHPPWLKRDAPCRGAS